MERESSLSFCLKSIFLFVQLTGIHCQAPVTPGTGCGLRTKYVSVPEASLNGTYPPCALLASDRIWDDYIFNLPGMISRDENGYSIGYYYRDFHGYSYAEIQQLNQFRTKSCVTSSYVREQILPILTNQTLLLGPDGWSLKGRQHTHSCILHARSS